MKHLTPIEFGGLILGVIFFVGGLVFVIWPEPGVVAHFTSDSIGASPHYEMENVGRGGSRVYGILGLALGFAIALFSVYRSKARG